MEALERENADILGGRWDIQSGGAGWGKAIAALQHVPVGSGNGAHRVSKKPERADCAAYPMFRRKVFEVIGGYRESLPATADRELYHRARNAGLNIMCDPSIVTTYYARPTVRAYLRQNIRNATYSTAFPFAARLRHWVPLVFLIINLALLGLSGFFTIARWGFGLLWATYFAVAAVSLKHVRHPGMSWIDRLRTLVLMPAVHLSFGTGWIIGWLSPATRRIRAARGTAPQTMAQLCEAARSIPCLSALGEMRGEPPDNKDLNGRAHLESQASTSMTAG